MLREADSFTLLLMDYAASPFQVLVRASSGGPFAAACLGNLQTCFSLGPIRVHGARSWTVLLGDHPCFLIDTTSPLFSLRAAVVARFLLLPTFIINAPVHLSFSCCQPVCSVTTAIISAPTLAAFLFSVKGSQVDTFLPYHVSGQYRRGYFGYSETEI